ncbi:hypothetical protein DFP72DRAFT_919647 [Ephemerocybe angulata]|uniref:BTB domain-containing protein n=1 Tax=Ephemerocybe angulata TaxID=980116 RepID=A0A8H6HIA8_9AGAR|nr:hypothetical protein DFP72DRAFT_919647 [Tulosesus angulatus]
MADNAESAGPPSTTSGPFLAVDHKTVHFEVEGLVYHVCRYGFETYSLSVFRDMFALPQGSHEESAVGATSEEGATRENPIKLMGCTTSEFQSLIEVMYPRQLSGPPALTKEEWIGVLKVARLWDMPAVAKVAIEKLSIMDLKPVEKIKLGKEHGVPKWLKEGYIALVDDLSIVSQKEMETLSWQTAFRVLWARDQIARKQEGEGGSGGLWTRMGTLYCGYCSAQHRSHRRQISNPQTSCSYCNNVPATSGYGLIVLDNTALTTATPPPGDKSKLVADKVAEVFEEDLKEAELRDTAVPEVADT